MTNQTKPELRPEREMFNPFLTTESSFSVSHLNCSLWSNEPSPYSRAVNGTKMHLKAEKSWRGICKICTITYPQPSITHWHTGQTLSHLYSVSAKRSCGSSQGCDLISEPSSFVLELRLYADKQVHNPFGSRMKGE